MKHYILWTGKAHSEHYTYFLYNLNLRLNYHFITQKDQFPHVNKNICAFCLDAESLLVL